jgi:hypothetical protein
MRCLEPSACAAFNAATTDVGSASRTTFPNNGEYGENQGAVAELNISRKHSAASLFSSA